MTQMKKQIKTPEKELNEMKISNVSYAEFRTLVIRMLNEFNENLNSVKKIHPQMKDTVIEIKNNLQGINNRADKAKNQINNLDSKEEKTTNQNCKKKKESKKKIRIV